MAVIEVDVIEGFYCIRKVIIINKIVFLDFTIYPL